MNSVEKLFKFTDVTEWKKVLDLKTAYNLSKCCKFLAKLFNGQVLFDIYVSSYYYSGSEKEKQWFHQNYHRQNPYCIRCFRGLNWKYPKQKYNFVAYLSYHYPKICCNCAFERTLNAQIRIYFYPDCWITVNTENTFTMFFKNWKAFSDDKLKAIEKAIECKEIVQWKWWTLENFLLFFDCMKSYITTWPKLLGQQNEKWNSISTLTKLDENFSVSFPKNGGPYFNKRFFAHQGHKNTGKYSYGLFILWLEKIFENCAQKNFWYPSR